MIDESGILSNLNPEQAAAVTHGEGPLLVLAGAGSGKTRVLTHRIAYLLAERGVHPHEILAVTFTNKAAAEMAERVRDLVGPRGDGIWVSTFHSACVRILRRDADRIGYPRHFVIYDDADQQSLIKRLIKDRGLTDKDVSPRWLSYHLDQMKNGLERPEDYARAIPDAQRERFVALQSAYAAAMRESGAVDFGDLIALACRLLESEADVRDYYRDRFRHILVDEFQDTNRAQYVLLRWLLGGHNNLLVVGDDDQSIYSWRGARIANILGFESDFENVRKVLLERNYRSTGVILDAAWSVVSHNAGRQPKRLFTDNPRGEPVVYYRADDEYDEARFVVDRVRALHRSGALRRMADVAVFYRTNAQSRVVEDELRGAKLPYMVVGGTRFYDRKEIKDALAYLRILVNPADSVSLLRIVNVPARGIGNATVDKAARLAQQLGVPVLAAIEKAVDGEVESGFAKTASRRLAEFVRIVRDLRKLVDTAKPSELLAAALDRSGYLDWMQADDSVEGETRRENLQELQNALIQFERKSPDDGLPAFLEQVALISDPDQYDDRADVVSLMTLHCAKGLEFPVVFLIGMEQNLFPHARSRDSDAEFEEERRLCYVGFTRAKSRLFLTNARRRNQFGTPLWNAESPFIDDIPGDLLDVQEGGPPRASNPALPWIRRAAAKKKPAAEQLDQSPTGDDFAQADPTWDEPVWTDDAALEWPVHCRVVDDRFGEGTVLESDGSGENVSVTVQFDRGGVRTIRTGYAPIRKIGS